MDDELPPPLSDEEGSGYASASSAGSRPGLVSDSSSEASSSSDRRHASRLRERALRTPPSQPSHPLRPPGAPPNPRLTRAGGEPPPPPSAYFGGGGPFGGQWDDIDRSGDEWDDDGAMYGEMQDYMGGRNDELLQQVPVQELLEALLNSGDAGPLAGLLAGSGGGGGLMLPVGTVFGGPPAMLRRNLPGVEARIPAGLDRSAWAHALSLAELGFVTALDPARHAACAAEGVPGGRRVMTPRAAGPGSPPAPRQQQGGAAAAAGPFGRAGGGGLQRADSAAQGGGLQRGDSAASQGMSRVARAAAGAGSGGGGAAGGAGGPQQLPRQAVSRLASTGRSGAAGGPPDDDLPGLASASETGSDSDAVPLRAARGASPCSSLPDLASAGSDSGTLPELTCSDSDSDAPPGLYASSGSGSEQRAQRPISWREMRRRAAARRGAPEPPAQQQAVRGRHASASPGSSGASGSAQGSSGPPQQQGGGEGGGRASASPPRRRQRRNAVFGRLPGLGTGGSSGGAQRADTPDLDDVGSDAGPGARSGGGASSAASSAASEASNASLPGLIDTIDTSEEEEQGGSGGGMPALSDGSSGTEGSGGRLPGLVSEMGDSDSSVGWEASPRPGRAAPAAGGRQAPGGRAAHASVDQRAVMQALTALLPQQGDAAGWAELAGFVRGRGSGGAHSSGGGVQLLSRLVAAAARRYPAEAEAAGLTERPLAPLPSLSAAGSPPAAATAAAAAAPPWAGSGAAAAAGSPGVAPATAASAANAASSRPPPPSLRQQEQHWGQVTFVAESPEAAEQLRRELGPTVTVVSESEEAAAEQPAAAGPPAAGRRPLPPPSVTLVLPSLEAYDAFWERPELNTLNVMVVAEPDYLAAFEEQEGHLDRQLALLQPVAALQGPAATASALGLAASQVTGGAMWQAQQRQMESLSDAMAQSMQAASEQLTALAAGAPPPPEPEQ